jgi:predicted nucleic acid-binding Zn ribbon protein
LIEKIQKFSDPPLSTHDACGGKLELVLSPPAIQFKGSGFYITDYARKSSSAGEGGRSSEGGSKSSDSGSKAGDGGSKGTGSESTKPTAAKKDSG